MIQPLILGTMFLLALAVLVYRRSGGIATLPFVCFGYLILLYIGSLDFYLRQGSNTWLHLLACGAAFTAGIWLVPEKPSFVDEKKKVDRLLSLKLGVHPQILCYTLAILSALGIAISVVLLSNGEIPLFQTAVASAMIKLTKGPVGHLLTSLGYDNLSFCALGWYVLFTIRRRKIDAVLCITCLLLTIVFATLVGTKVAGFYALIWITMGVSYIYRRKIKLRTFTLMALFAIPISLWATSYYIRWEVGVSPTEALWDRATTIAVEPLNFIITVWAPRYGYLHGQSFLTEISRIIANATGAPQPVLLDEYIWGFLNTGKPDISTGLGSSLALYGTGYANFGTVGAMVLVALFGVVCQYLNTHLLSGRSRHFLWYAVDLYLVYQLILTCWIAGMPIIALQTFLLTVVPKIVLFILIYKFLCLPFRIPLAWTAPQDRIDRVSAAGEASKRSA